MLDQELSMEEQENPIRLWRIMVLLAFIGTLINIGIISVSAAGQYNQAVHYKDYYLPDPQHNCSHFMALHFVDAENPSGDAGTKMFCQDLDVGKVGDSKEEKRGRWIGRYFFALREDDRWVDMQVHHVVCWRHHNFGGRSHLASPKY